jgi:hypothetical protein
MATAIRRTEAELKALMPNQVIPPIGSDTEEPTWQQIQLCSTLCAANAAAIDSDGGDGLLGHVFIVIGGERYEEISDGNVPYIEPPPAGPPPTYPANMSYHDKQERKRAHIKADTDHYTFITVKKIVAQQVMDAVHLNYKASFHTEELGYRGTFEAVMTYLVQEFGKKSQKELEANEVELKQPWNTAVPISSPFLSCRQVPTPNNTKENTLPWT